MPDPNLDDLAAGRTVGKGGSPSRPSNQRGRRAGGSYSGGSDDGDEDLDEEARRSGGEDLDELRWAKRMRQQDPEGFKDLVTKTGSPTRPRASSPPSDDGDNRGRMNDHGGIAIADDLKFDDVKSITLGRAKLVKLFMEPFFEDLVSGCFVRLGIGKTKSGPKYRLCIVRNVDASDPDRQYKLGSHTTCKYLNAVWDTEANAARWQMTQVSDSPVLEQEFKDWLQDAEKNGVRIPTRQQVLDKKEAIQKASTSVCSAATVKQMLREKNVAAADKDRLRDQLEMALVRRDQEEEAERIPARRLHKIAQPMPNNDKAAAKLEEMNRADNFKTASEMKAVDTSLKAGEAGYDDPSSRNYHAAKPQGEAQGDNAGDANGNADSAMASTKDVKGDARD